MTHSRGASQCPAASQRPGASTPSVTRVESYHQAHPWSLGGGGCGEEAGKVFCRPGTGWRPSDSKQWNATSSCFENLQNHSGSILSLSGRSGRCGEPRPPSLRWPHTVRLGGPGETGRQPFPSFLCQEAIKHRRRFLLNPYLCFLLEGVPTAGSATAGRVFSEALGQQCRGASPPREPRGPWLCMLTTVTGGGH